jgi:putative MATE family efflux protein
LFSKPIFELMGGFGEVLEGAVDYARLAFGGALAVWASFTLSAILRGTGDTATPARAIIVSSAAQLPLSAVLTLGWGGLPSIGVAGPAAAMVLCHSAAAIYLALYVLRGRARIRLRPHSIRWLSILDIMRVGGLGCVNSLTIALTVVVVTGFVGQYGTAALAGYGLGSRLELMLIPIAFGLGAALTAAVGTNFGAGQFARARRAAWLGAGLTFAITTVLGVGAALMPSLWLDGFTTDPEVFAYGALYLLIVAPFYGLFGAGQTLYFASQGTGRMLAPVLVGVTRLLVVCSVGACALALSWEVHAVFAAVAAGLTTIGLGLGLCMFTRAWCPDAAT